ncbi:MAG: hypothetical protein JOZ09_14615 [Pseudonocardiales bacterium]|nr:hypothetical protein [Pseudonocardiales bacterium]
MGHEKITTSLQLYIHCTDDESRILDAHTDKPRGGRLWMLIERELLAIR